MFRAIPVFQGVPVFRGVPGCSGVPVFRCSGVPVFQCSTVPRFSTCRIELEPACNGGLCGVTFSHVYMYVLHNIRTTQKGPSVIR